MVIRWREGLEIGSSQVVHVSGLPWSYEVTERRMGRRGTHGSRPIPKYDQNERFSQDVRVEFG